jgi:hypothetical protein
MTIVHTMGWEDPVTKNKYDITIGLKRMVDHLVFSTVLIESLDGTPITVETYRRVPIVQFVQVARERVLTKPTLTTEHSGAHRGSALSEDVLREVARIYKESCNYGIPPIPSIAKAFNISKSTSAKRVMSAREHGFLNKAVRGKAGEKLK